MQQNKKVLANTSEIAQFSTHVNKSQGGRCERHFHKLTRQLCLAHNQSSLSTSGPQERYNLPVLPREQPGTVLSQKDMNYVEMSAHLARERRPSLADRGYMPEFISNPSRGRGLSLVVGV